MGDATLVLTPLADNAVRVQYQRQHLYDLPDEWLYVPQSQSEPCRISVSVDAQHGTLRFYDAQGTCVTTVTNHSLTPVTVQDRQAYAASMTMTSPADEYITGLGQFQDGLGNLRGMSRRLTQVNTQISIPLFLSNKGYGVLWNNYGMTEFNPSDLCLPMLQEGEEGSSEIVNVTSTEGSKQERRRSNTFRAEIDIDRPGNYSVLLDVGQSMARRHHLTLDGHQVIDVRNVWLPPTTTVRVHLDAGHHVFASQLTNGDKPVLQLRRIDATTTLQSPVADKVDYTIFFGSPDEIIATYRQLTGPSPMMPLWALGYIHCRERYHSSAEILDNVRTFRQHQLPLDVIVQDWQWWGSHGWNSMQFDEQAYPDPSALTAQLHDSLHTRLMLSVWSKIDDQSDLGREMKSRGYYIPGTTWIDFFNPDAANSYWQNFSQKLLVHDIDAWWQDATEPENDDLLGRTVCRGTIAGEQVRNVYPLLVSQTVYDGLRRDDASRRAMILTRSGFPGIQRYGSTLWSGDVGNDWETLRRQITGGLGLMAAGHPWWTYDAGGFFRPGQGQYQDQDYIQRMLRWIQCSTFLPLMRTHGYMTDTEPWRYGEAAEAKIRQQLYLRYRLLPYIYSAAADVSYRGGTLMRPLLFDFADDSQALSHDTQYMFGRTLLVNPVVQPDVTTYPTYLPQTPSGWYDFHSGQHYAGGQTVVTPVTLDYIPVFVRAGSILPLGPVKQYSQQTTDEPTELIVYPGADATFELYEDEGDNYNYEQGARAVVPLSWNDATRTLIIDRLQGSYPGMPSKRQFLVRLHDGSSKTVTYRGKPLRVRLK